MTDENYPAKYTVFWPGQTIHCCERHYQGVVALARAMAMPIPDRREEGGHQCENCMNERVGGEAIDHD